MRIAIVFLVALAACNTTENHMGLLDDPPTRPRTYVEGTPVDPNDMNEIFDAIIELKNDRVYSFSPINGGGNNAATKTGATTLALADPGVWEVPLTGFVAGQKIKSVSVAVFGNGVDDLNWNILRITAPNSEAAFAGAAIVNPPAAWNDYTYDFADFDIVAGEILVASFDPVGANIVIGPIRVTLF